MRPVAVLADYVLPALRAGSEIHLRMKLMFRGCIFVARFAVDRINLRLVRNVLRIETDMARNTRHFSV